MPKGRARRGALSAVDVIATWVSLRRPLLDATGRLRLTCLTKSLEHQSLRADYYADIEIFIIRYFIMSGDLCCHVRQARVEFSWPAISSRRVLPLMMATAAFLLKRRHQGHEYF